MWIRGATAPTASRPARRASYRRRAIVILAALVASGLAEISGGVTLVDGARVLAPAVAKAQAAAPAPPTTETIRFLATADLHFKSLGNNQTIGSDLGDGYYSDLGSNQKVASESCPKVEGSNHCDNVTNVAVLKAMMETMRDSGGAVSGVITAGDQMQHTANDEWDAFRTIIESYGAADKVYEGLGNHDVGCSYRKHNAQPTGCWPQTQATDIGSRARAASNYHTCYDELKDFGLVREAQDCPSYSWDFGGVHFVQLNVYPQSVYADVRVGSKITHHGLTFLQYDLGKYASDGRPVVLIHHYGFDAFSTGANGGKEWWTKAERLDYWNAIAPYNVALIVQGHAHPDHFDATATDASPTAVSFERPTKAAGYSADGDPRGGTSIPSLVAGPACIESCGGSQKHGGWWVDVTMTRTGNQGTITATQKRTVPKNWEAKYTTPYTKANGFGIDIAVHYNDVTEKETSSYASWTSDFAFRHPAGVSLSAASHTGEASATPNLPLTVELKDASGAALDAGADTRVALTTSSPTGRFSASSGGAAVTSVTVPQGASSTTIYYGDPVAREANLWASITTKDLVGSAYSLEFIRVTPGPIDALAFTTPPATGDAAVNQTLVGPITVELRDALGNPSSLRRDPTTQNLVDIGLQTVTLRTSSTTGYFSQQRGSGGYTATECNCYLIGDGNESMTFYYGDTRPGSRTITAAVASESAGQNVAVVSGAPASLRFTTFPGAGPRASAAGAANIGPIAATLKDAAGNTTKATTDLTVTLSSTSGTGVFAATSGGTPLTSRVIARGTSTVSFFYGDTVVGSPTITASATGTTPASRDLVITDGPPSRLSFTSAPVTGTTNAGPRLGPITVGLVNSSGNPTTATTDTVVDLSSDSVQGLFGDQLRDVVTSVTIPAGSPSVDFHYGDRRAGTPTITASAAGLVSATQRHTITAGTPRWAYFTTPPMSGQASAATNIGPITVGLLDCFDNPVAAEEDTLLYVGGDGGISSTVGGPSTSSSNVTLVIPRGSASTSFFFGKTQAGIASVSVMAPTIVDPKCDPTRTESRNPQAFQAVTVTPGPVARMAFTTSPLTGKASATAGLGPSTVRLYDQFSNAAPARTATTLNLASTSPKASFASTPAGTEVSSVQIPVGSSSASFFYGDEQAGSPEVSVSSTGPASIAQRHVITPAVAAKLVFTSIPASGAVGLPPTIGPLAIAVRDTFGNPTGVAAATTVNLSSDSTTGRFAAARGGPTITSLALAAGAGAASFYYGDTTAGTPTITAAATGLTRATQQVQLLQPPAFATPGSTTFTVTAPGSFVVRASGSPIPTIALTGALPPGVSFTDNQNGTATMSGTPASGTAGDYPVTLTASNGFGADATQAFTLVVGKASTTTIVTSPVNPSILGQAVAFTATVSPTAGATGQPAGNVEFFNGGSSIGSAPLNTSGVAQLSTAALPVGRHSVTAVYQGDVDFHGSNSGGTPLTQDVTYEVALLYDHTSSNRAGSTIPITVALQNVAGENVSSRGVVLTVTGISPSPGGTVPTGQTFAFLGSDDCPNDTVACPRYIFRLGTKNYGPGSYDLLISATNDPVVHRAPFKIG